MLEQIRSKMDAVAGDYPIYQYEFFRANELIHSENVRYICRTECPMYGKSWSCPPGCGSLEECTEKCRAFQHGLVFSTVTEVEDAANLEETLPTRAEHTVVVREIVERVFDGKETLVLSCESCSFCENCTYPANPCRFPDKMLPCIEGYGIIVTALAERLGMDFYLPGNTVLWFGIILFREA